MQSGIVKKRRQKMDITDMILVTENYKGAETNYLMDISDYLNRIDGDGYFSKNELAENMCELGRTLAWQDDWTEIYFAANKTVSARYCADEEQLGMFLQGYYNDTKQEWWFDEQMCSEACLKKLKDIGMDKKGWITGVGLHYEKMETVFQQGQILHNFNNRDYRVMECLSEKNLILQDVKSGNFVVGLGVTAYMRSPADETPTKDNTRIGIEWDYGVYLPNMLSAIDFKVFKEKYGAQPKEELPAREDGRFDVEIKEILSRVEPIEAETLGEAIDKAMDMYYSEKIVLDAEDMKDVDFIPYTDKTNKTR